MMFGKIVEKLVGGTVQIVASSAAVVTDYLKARAEIKSRERTRKLELEDAIHARRVELIKQGLAADASWEELQIRSSGWKDEYVLIVLSIGMIGCFVPGCAPYVLAGFAALSQTPNWYQWLIVLIFTAVYGIRIYRRQQSDT
jgi:hypothetical protein